ncbi:hypothetical protein NO995_10280 [Aestuariibaculum sp. M13]|uniref:hypothetical protein n=1 Tax=Aestuariibaculum sp. M13 TaxID=2967132 RepID=UPI002159FE4F|nr:hypothetical protein [Aestuariibaculum sp. M13]MCR8668070.1 hypothetical protein [Aestuariibaculum sp. M13]
MRKIFILIIVLGILSCNNSENKNKTLQKEQESTEIENRVNEEKKIIVNKDEKIDSIIEPIKPKLIFTDLEKEIAEVGISFHRWYIKNTNEHNPETPTEFEVTEGKNDSCIVNYEPYFKELRKLGTISNSFLDKEKARTKLCAETISNMKWSEYIGVIPENCDDYLYWTNSQDITDGVDIIELNKENDYWTVFLSLFMSDKNGQKYFGNDKLKVTVIKENGKYLISEINWIIK